MKAEKFFNLRLILHFVFLIFVIMFWFFILKSGKKYTYEMTIYNSVVIEKYTKEFEYDQKSEKYGAMKFFKYYAVDKYGTEEEIQKNQYDTIHLKKDSCRFYRFDKVYEVDTKSKLKRNKN
jgi:hypothetical protein